MSKYKEQLTACLATVQDVSVNGCERGATIEPTDRNLLMVAICIYWLQQQGCRDSVNRRIGTSYGLKHLVEKDSGYYVSNGAFIAAAQICGRTTARVGYDHSNVYVSLPSKLHRLTSPEYRALHRDISEEFPEFFDQGYGLANGVTLRIPPHFFCGSTSEAA